MATSIATNVLHCYTCGNIPQLDNGYTSIYCGFNCISNRSAPLLIHPRVCNSIQEQVTWFKSLLPKGAVDTVLKSKKMIKGTLATIANNNISAVIQGGLNIMLSFLPILTVKIMAIIPNSSKRKEKKRHIEYIKLRAIDNSKDLSNWLTNKWKRRSQ